ncbi:MAG: HD-GYP domain-containing protein [Proteobacteria bacterium]|nr:HD-GYP domain-containing protein [Pseudomonadota bacterium]
MERAAEALKYISGGLKVRTLYPAGHPAIMQQVEKSYSLISELLREHKRLMLAMVDDVFIIQDEPNYEASEYLGDFLRMFKEKKVERVTFHEGLEKKEMDGFYEILAAPMNEIRTTEGGLQAAFDSRGLTHIVLERLEKEKRDIDMLARKIYTDALDVLDHVISEVRLGKLPTVDKTQEVISEMVGVVLEDKNAILGLTMIKGYDNYLFNHSVNVSILAVALGEALDLPESTLNDLGIGALLHDIGKTNTPEDIVKKPGKLDETEWEVMQQHPALGHEILSSMKDIHKTSADIAYEHHLRYDKTDGYPFEAIGRDTNPCSQIVSIADIYDAITTLRPYKDVIGPNEALKIMKKLVGTTLNPDYFKNFVTMLGIYPAGTLVRLDTGEVALVCRPNYAKPLRPEVKIIFNLEGEKTASPELLSLEEMGDDHRPERSIVGTVDSVFRDIDLSEYLESAET